MSSPNINVYVDEHLKEKAELLFNNLGLSMASGIALLLHNAIAHGSIEAIQPPYNEETRAALDEYNAMKSHPEKYKRYHSFSELLEDLDHEEP